jgi:hypothetical protein
MEDPRLKRSYLERLSSGELVNLADSYGIDIPPGLDRIFIIKELLELGHEGDSGGKGSVLREQDLLEPAPLPRHYNVTFIDVLLRDPLWAFAFWGIKSHDKEIYEKADGFEGYFLKVIPLANDKSGNPQGDDPFIIPVGIKDSSWYIGFPPTGGRFKVGFCMTRGGCEVPLALSLPFRIPVFLNLPEGEYEKNRKNPLVCLSGLDDLPVLRNTDRLSRIPRRGIP